MDKYSFPVEHELIISLKIEQSISEWWRLAYQGKEQRYNLRQDFQDWLDIMIRGKYYIKAFEGNGPTIEFKSFRIIFADPADAILYKLTWLG